MTLRDVRKARELTQERMAELLGIRQDSISKLEKRTDLLLSTLRSYLNAMGGSLQLIVEFPDRPPVVITGLAELDEKEEKAKYRQV
ncbi:MAG: helix-turn-helix domain-containing protein [Nostoc sp.]